jgi:hypothetical protein
MARFILNARSFELPAQVVGRPHTGFGLRRVASFGTTIPLYGVRDPRTTVESMGRASRRKPDVPSALHKYARFVGNLTRRACASTLALSFITAQFLAVPVDVICRGLTGSGVLPSATQSRNCATSKAMMARRISSRALNNWRKLSRASIGRP